MVLYLQNLKTNSVAPEACASDATEFVFSKPSEYRHRRLLSKLLYLLLIAFFTHQQSTIPFRNDIAI